MKNSETEKKPLFSNYMYVLYRWRKFIIINILIVLVLTSAISFLIPNQYKSTATIMIPPDTQAGMSGLGGIAGLLGNKSSISAIGSKILGGSSSVSEDLILGIINSRASLTHFIRKFGLIDYYKISDRNLDKTLKEFTGDLSAESNEFNMIDISIINKDPNTSAKIANYIVHYVDSVNIKINGERAKNNREFIEKRYYKNLSDLKTAEDSMYKFQRKYGIVAVPEQLEVSVKAAAEVEAMQFKKEMELYFTKQMYGESAPQTIGAQTELDVIKNKVKELKSSSSLGQKSNILFAFKDLPDIAIDYLRVYREVEIQQSILEIVMPMYEQAKVEEQKSMPTIVVIDKAVPAELKHSPKRMFIVIGVVLLVMFMLIPLVFFGDNAIQRQTFGNPLQEKETKFYKRVVAYYKMKF